MNKLTDQDTCSSHDAHLLMEELHGELRYLLCARALWDKARPPLWNGDRGRAAMLTARRNWKELQQSQIIRKYSVSAIESRQRKHLSPCSFVNAFVAFSSSTLISFVPRVSPFHAGVLDCNNDWRKQCIFLFSIPSNNTDGFIFLPLSHSASPFSGLWFMSLLPTVKINYFHQQELAKTLPPCYIMRTC